MDNYKLLEKYRKKLSIYFAIFVLISFWIIQAIFLIIEYIPHNISLEKSLIKRFTGVENVIKNQEKYEEKLNNNDTTLGKVLAKTLEDVIVYEGCNNGICDKKIVSNIDNEDEILYINEKDFFDIGEYKYLKKNFIFEDIEYRVIIRIHNENSIEQIFSYYLYFLIFSMPFAVIFYIIGYNFVGNNFKPIRETISGLEDFTANINHEMKTPLSEIISTLCLAKKIKNYDEAIDSSLESSKKLTKILDSMLGIVNLVDSSYKKEKFDIIKEIEYIVSENEKIINTKALLIKTSFKNKQYFLKINRQHFNICVGNILKNSIKYSDEKGLIEINFENGKLDIKDYGIGISRKNLKNIFNRYFRENYINQEGYGLGLSLVKKIVDLHGWKIKIKSQKRKSINGSKGTLVTIYFKN